MVYLQEACEKSSIPEAKSPLSDVLYPSILIYCYLGTFIWVLGTDTSSPSGTTILILQYGQLVLHPALETLLIVDIRKPLLDMVTF